VPTDIYFAGDRLSVVVDEDPSQVAEAFTSADGRPFRLTAYGAQGEVYVNPDVVAFWSTSESIPPAEPAPDSPPNRRDTVTDIWGSPLRKKPRR